MAQSKKIGAAALAVAFLPTLFASTFETRSKETRDNATTLRRVNRLSAVTSHPIGVETGWWWSEVEVLFYCWPT